MRLKINLSEDQVGPPVRTVHNTSDYTLRQIFTKLCTGVIYKTLSIEREFLENRFLASHTSCKGTNTFLSVIFIFLTDLDEIRYRRPSPLDAVERL